MKTIDDFHGKVAVVTGGASGIGRGIAESLIARGATTVIASRDIEAAQQVAAKIGAHARPVDVRNAHSVDDLARGVQADHGRIDIVVNNAGVGPLAPFDDLTSEDFQWVMEVNFLGVVHGVKSFLPLLQQNPEGGCIVNVASVAAMLPGPGATAYSASKAAVVAFGDALAAELAANPENKIGVYVLLSGPVRTNIAQAANERPGLREGALEPKHFLPPLPILEPAEVGELVADALQSGQRYSFTHPQTSAAIRAHQDVVRAMLPGAAQNIG